MTVDEPGRVVANPLSRLTDAVAWHALAKRSDLLGGKSWMLEPQKSAFDPEVSMARAGHGRRIVKFSKKQNGLIDYGGRIQVHRTLLDAILRDRLPGDNTASPEIFSPVR
jgi:hypothetical protein